MALSEFADKFKKWASRYGVEFIPDGPPPTPIRESDGLPVGSVPLHNLPSTFAEMGQPQEEEDDSSTASIWAQILCGRGGDVKIPRVRTAAELQRKNLGTANEAFSRTWGRHIQLDDRVGRSDAVQPQQASPRQVAAQQMRDAHARLKAQGLDLA